MAFYAEKMTGASVMLWLTLASAMRAECCGFLHRDALAVRSTK
jgi:hypothetical protein